MHLIFLPMYYAQSWYLVVANFRTGRFEVICPISMDCNEIERDASTVIQNFKWMFKLAYPHSVRVNVFKMSTTTLIASSAKNLCDSGIFVMKFMKSHDGDKQRVTF
ncbi:hypothetical protein BS78_K059700 [Paspalum vaginatum]|uniref:Ubiquitin-like protease family profile domain-containing protein n=1 Tax=Paspalum vaginatum TaxID=158149 RepID=A0A9W7XC58_9POAL|nr:hypothetical protein BS78_K059700 [Paspalum vaginatum]